MNWRLFPLLLLLCTSVQGAIPALIATNSADDGNSGTTAHTIALPSPGVPAGTGIVLGIRVGSGVTLAVSNPVTSVPAQTWIPVPTPTPQTVPPSLNPQVDGAGNNLYLYEVKNANVVSSGSLTVTVTLSGNQTGRLAIASFSGHDTTNPIDIYGSRKGSGLASLLSFTTTNYFTLGLAFIEVDNSTAPTIQSGSGWTRQQAAGKIALATRQMDQIGTYATNWTVNNDMFAEAVVAIKGASPIPTPTASPSASPTPTPGATGTPAPTGTPSPAPTGLKYIKQGGTGNGSDWNNALGDIPSTLVRGTTYYVAGGSYGAHTFNSLAGTAYVVIKKANATENSGVAGWQASYGTDQAVFTSAGNVLTISQSNLLIEGVTGDEVTATGFGIKLVTTGTTTAAVYSGGGCDGLRVKHCEMAGVQPGGGVNFVFNIQAYPGANNLLLQYCYLHGGSSGVVLTGTGQIVDHCRLSDMGYAQHNEMITVNTSGSGYTVRYCILENQTWASTTYIEPQGTGGIINGLDVYGNIFIENIAAAGTTNAALIAATGTDSIINCKVYNNTIYRLGYHASNGHTGVGDNNNASQFDVRNNLWIDCGREPQFGGATTTHSHNFTTGVSSLIAGEIGGISGGSNALTYPGSDFHIVALSGPKYPKDKGTDLGPPYNYDRDDNLRGDDGAWDIGAYENQVGEYFPPIFHGPATLNAARAGRLWP